MIIYKLKTMKKSYATHSVVYSSSEPSISNISESFYKTKEEAEKVGLKKYEAAIELFGLNHEFSYEIEEIVVKD